MSRQISANPKACSGECHPRSSISTSENSLDFADVESVRALLTACVYTSNNLDLNLVDSSLSMKYVGTGIIWLKETWFHGFTT